MLNGETEIVRLVGGPEDGGRRMVPIGSKEAYIVVPIAGGRHYHLIYRRDDITSQEMRFIGDDYQDTSDKGKQ